MSFFSKLFKGSRSESPESRLAAQSTQAFMDSPAGQEMIESAKQEVIKRGWASQGTNCGEQFLQREASEPQVHSALEELRKEGVRDADIRWYWNLSPLERVLMEKTDEIMRLSTFMACRSQGMEPEQAGKATAQTHALFGNPAVGEGDDRPLPIELKQRIWVYTEKHHGNPDVYRMKSAQASSFNALVRQEMRKGNL